METKTRFNSLQDSNGTWLHVRKPEIIPGHPDGEFADINCIDKDIGQQFLGSNLSPFLNDNEITALR